RNHRHHFMNPRTVSRITGLLLLMVSFAMAGCAAFAWLDPMPSPPGAALALIQAAGVTCIFSFLLVASGGLNFKIERILRRDAVLVVGLGWILSSGFGALPFVLAEPGLNFAGGFFEAA